MPRASSAAELKSQVRDFWNANPCGSRYLGDHSDFETHARIRYELEPYIFEFAGFAAAAGKRVLEIGVGMGADYLEWLKGGAVATGVDLSEISLARARRRAEMAGYTPDLRVSDAESLPFPENTFDIVYSYGVLHHSPDTERCLAEAHRVLKPGGSLRVMIYHHPSWIGLMLWLRYGIWRGQSLRRTIFHFLESPGTKSYSLPEARHLVSRFEQVDARVEFSPGDLLLNEPSQRFRGGFYQAIWKLYPRGIVRGLGRRFGLFLLISAVKPK